MEEAAEDAGRVRLRERGAGVRVSEGLDGDTVSGSGAALGGAEVEQDAAYWELRVLALPAGAGCCAGVARQSAPLDGPLAAAARPQLLGSALEEDEEAPSAPQPQSVWALSSEVAGLAEGDVVGVAFGQGEIPNLRFFRNGEPLERESVAHVRGTVCPAFSVQGGAVLAVSFERNAFRFRPPANFSELLPTRSIL